MADIEEIAGPIRKNLDEKEKARESALKSTREIVRTCRTAISKMHSGGDFTEDLAMASRRFSDLREELSAHPDLLFAGYSVSAQQELAEAEILRAAISGDGLPSPDDIGVSDEAYILGIADAIGELRRSFLEALMRDEIAGARSLLAKTEEFFEFLTSFDYPDALVPVKRKQDIARSILEKCRGELALAHQMSSLSKKISKQ